MTHDSRVTSLLIDTIVTMTSKGRFNRKALASIPAVTPIGSDEPVSVSLPKAVERIAKTLNPVKIILFGSYAYGTPTPDSDVDLLVIWGAKDMRETERHWAVSELLAPRPFPVDILAKTPNEIDRYLAQRNIFFVEVLKKGKTLYEQRRSA